MDTETLSDTLDDYVETMHSIERAMADLEDASKQLSESLDAYQDMTSSRRDAARTTTTGRPRAMTDGGRRDDA